MTENPYPDKCKCPIFCLEAWNEGHAVGKVEGSEETLDAVEKEIGRCSTWPDLWKRVEALRKKVSE